MKVRGISQESRVAVVTKERERAEARAEPDIIRRLRGWMVLDCVKIEVWVELRSSIVTSGCQNSLGVSGALCHQLVWRDDF